MTNHIDLTFTGLLNHNKQNFSQNKALGFDNERMMTYAEMHKHIESVQQKLINLGVKPGDKVALFSNNAPNWGIAYFSVVSMGAVIVPILPDLQSEEIKNILEHSEAKAIFASEKLKDKLDKACDYLPETVITIDNFKVEKGESKPVELSLPDIHEDDLAAIIYTSGATGKSKGVMLTHKNLVTNAIQGHNVQPINEDDRFLSVLPLSHAYENTLGLLLPVLYGASVTYLRKPPTAAILMPALKRVQPTMMLTVPMIIEKVVRNKVFARFEKGGFITMLYQFLPLRKLIHYLAGKIIKSAFGGQLKFFGIGGARLDKKVERFLLDAKFPYAIGYGLTETAPLSAGCNPDNTKLRSIGPAVKWVQLKISNGQDGGNPGEVLIKGPNVMKGYYKNPELTQEVFTDDNYFRTGDLGALNVKGRLYLKGRSKNMIVGANGENIYPEDIETVINNYAYVIESVVIERKGKLIALVHFNRQEIEEKVNHLREDIQTLVDKKMDELTSELHDFVNARVRKNARLQAIVVQNYEFEKTATHKIKRFMYQ
ncbi:MAG: AMP-binding protein [Candidatus Delongbacteria bacterium]|nr:AMP-binding protein [Candidatus Delongbacteria bacterium]